MLKSENACQKNDINVPKEQLHKVQIEKSFSVDRFKDDDKLFRFYTGLQDYKTFQILFELFGPVVNNIVYYDLNTKAENIMSSDFVKHGPKRLLRPLLCLIFMEPDQVINKLLMTVVYWICLRREILSWPTRDLK